MKTWRDYFNKVNETRAEKGVSKIDIENLTDFDKWMYGFKNVDDEMSEEDIERFM